MVYYFFINAVYGLSSIDVCYSH